MWGFGMGLGFRVCPNLDYGTMDYRLPTLSTLYLYVRICVMCICVYIYIYIIALKKLCTITVYYIDS